MALAVKAYGEGSSRRADGWHQKPLLHTFMSQSAEIRANLYQNLVA